MNWKRSTRCDSSHCVEVAATDVVRMRSTEKPEDVITVSAAVWRTFIKSIKEEK